MVWRSVHDLSRNLIRIWAAKYEASDFDDEFLKTWAKPSFF